MGLAVFSYLRPLTVGGQWRQPEERWFSERSLESSVGSM